ncbi:MAG: DoxX family protein [Saprospiraceae bacterium]|nr:DoxX family protein [Saprospiraceae bacterium]
MKNIIDLIGRILLSFIFLYDAYDSIFYFKATKVKMTAYGLTWNQDFLLIAAIFLLILGGLFVLLGYRARFGAILLLLYWIPVTFIVHSYWNDPEPERRLQALLFSKNLAIIGGLLMVWANGTGKYSVRKILATTRVRGT